MRKFRFKLRTLLLLLLFVAIVAAFYGNQAVQINAEAKAMNSLSSQWLIESETFSELEKQTSQSSWRRMADWPLRKLCGKNYVERCQALELYELNNANNKPKTYILLKDFGRLEKLTLGHVDGTECELNLDDADLASLSKLGSLKELYISQTDISHAGLAHLTNLPLQYLRCGGHGWGTKELNEIAKINTLRELELLSFSRDLTPLRDLTNLERLTIFVDSESRFESLTEIPNLTHLYLRGNFTAKQLEKLANASSLKSLIMEVWKLDDSQVRAVAELNNLKAVQLRGMISQRQNEILANSSLRIEHEGIRANELKKNYIAFIESLNQLDLDSCELTAHIAAHDPENVRWSISPNSPKYDDPFFSFESPGFVFNKGWRELSNFETTIDVPYASAFFHGGHHQTPLHHFVVVKSRKSNVFHLQWHFAEDWGAQGMIDASFEFRNVIVSPENETMNISLEDAKELFRRHFDISEFEAPEKISDDYPAYRFRFKAPN